MAVALVMAFDQTRKTFNMAADNLERNNMETAILTRWA